MTVVFRAASSI